jgi:hypothetical protein
MIENDTELCLMIHAKFLATKDLELVHNNAGVIIGFKDSQGRIVTPHIVFEADHVALSAGEYTLRDLTSEELADFGLSEWESNRAFIPIKRL